MAGLIEEIGRYIDGTLQDDVHPADAGFERVPNTGRDVPGGWACDFDVLLSGRFARITLTVTDAELAKSEPLGAA